MILNPISSSSSPTTRNLSQLFLPPLQRFHSLSPNPNSLSLLSPSKSNSVSHTSHFKPYARYLSSSSSPPPTIPASSSNSAESSNEDLAEATYQEDGFRGEVRNSSFPIPSMPKLSFNDQVFFISAFIATTTALAFTSFVIAAVPTLYAMSRAATSFSKLADTAREELPSTMTAIRLSSLEISDLTLEFSELSREITDGVTKSTQIVRVAEAGIRHIGAIARQQTISMIEERANLPIISVQPVVLGAAKKTSQAVVRVTKSLLNMISGGEPHYDSEDEDTDAGIERAGL